MSARTLVHMTGGNDDGGGGGTGGGNETGSGGKGSCKRSVLMVVMNVYG